MPRPYLNIFVDAGGRGRFRVLIMGNVFAMAQNTDSTASLVALLDLEQLDHDVFTGRVPSRLAIADVGAGERPLGEQRQRVYGGQIAAQSLAAALRTVRRPVHSLHAYFVSGADPDRPVRFAVERIRDGRSISNRQVRATQDGLVLFTLSASFHEPAEGVSHAEPMPDVPDPDTLPAPQGAEAFEWSSTDLRFVEQWGQAAGGAHVASRQVWMRVAEPLPPENAALQACALTYASDLTLIRTALAPHQAVVERRGITLASLDHSIWFHRPVRADDWMLYSSVSPSASDSRALAVGNLFARDGRLAATVIQEGLLRV
jgi:acyl-CoA thioesterase II